MRAREFINKQQGVTEGVPQPGKSSGKPISWISPEKVITKYLTLDEILNSVPGIPYYNDVVKDRDAKDFTWGVTKKVIEYAKELIIRPNAYKNWPPIIVVDGKLQDGAHRISTINLMQKRVQPNNPIWKNAKLKVEFGQSDNVKQGVAEGKISVKPSPGKGNGLFATKHIKAGEVITRSEFVPIDDKDWELIKNTTPVKLYGFKLRDKHALLKGPFKFQFKDPKEKALWDKTKFKDLSLSGFMFINGADTPDEVNSKENFNGNTAEMIATKDIRPGEEIIKQYNVSTKGVAEGSDNNTTAQKIFFARSNKAPKGWSYDHVGFITQDGKQIQMSGHKGNDVYVTNSVTDDPEFPKQNIKIVSLSKPVSVPTSNSVGAENCGTFVANVLQANGIKGIDTQKLYSVMKKPLKQDMAEAKYAGNIGIMELIKFFQSHPELKSEYDEIKREKGAIEAMNFALNAINAELEGEPYSVAEDQTEDENITVENNVETSFRGGYGGTLIAKTPDRQVGYLNYSIYNDKPQIGMIFVAQDYRRRGVAMKMLKALQELSPNEEIDWGITTDAGSNLRKSINYRKVPNPEIIKKKAKLAGVRSKLARLNYRLEQLKNTDVELARKFIKTVGDRWNQLNDLEYRLENELYLNKGEYSKLIPENK